MAELQEFTRTDVIRIVAKFALKIDTEKLAVAGDDRKTPGLLEKCMEEIKDDIEWD
jgi:hypothetical protein